MELSLVEACARKVSPTGFDQWARLLQVQFIKSRASQCRIWQGARHRNDPTALY